MPEIYAWPEGQLFLYSAAPGQTGNPIANVQGVNTDEGQDWDRQLSPASGRMANRVTFTLKDQVVNVGFRAYYTGIQLFQMYKSATAWNMDLQLVQSGVSASAARRYISGRFTRFRENGQEGGVWEADVAMTFAESSALW